jgi:MoxR-like ATPase
LGKINSALDATATLITANGEKIKRHPNFVLIGTTNIGYAGCKPMNASFVSRFHRIVKVEKLPAGDLLEIVINQSGNSDRVLVKKMIDAVEKISIKIKEEQIINGVSSTRELINWANETKYTSDPIESARVTILPSVGFDEELQEEIIDTILRPMF